jgi:hypothetical protein
MRSLQCIINTKHILNGDHAMRYMVVLVVVGIGMHCSSCRSMDKEQPEDICELDPKANISDLDIIQARSRVLGYETQIEQMIANHTQSGFKDFITDDKNTLIAAYEKDLLIIYPVPFYYVHVEPHNVTAFMNDPELLANAIEYKNNNSMPIEDIAVTIKGKRKNCLLS